MFKGKILKSSLAAVLAFSFFINLLPYPCAIAQDMYLPAPGIMVPLSPSFDPPILKGIKIHPDNPFRFDFILDNGNSQLGRQEIKEESTKLIKYFLASLTIPEKDLWVNLSPYEKDRIIPKSFGLTEMGRDLLGEDYMLKQITASLIYPEDEIGKRFWKRIYEEAQKKFGTTDIPVNTFNKVWIVPAKAVVYENAKAGTAYVVESQLKVMLDEDYLSLQKHGSTIGNNTHTLGSQIIREIVLPELSKEVNEGKNFAQLRQVYDSLILATWYKKKIKDSILTQVYSDQNKVAGVNIDDPQEKERIYQRYLRAFKKGVYNYIKDEVDPLTQESLPRKYFSGGTALYLDGILQETANDAMVAPGMNTDVHDNIIKIRLDPAMKTENAQAHSFYLSPSFPEAVFSEPRQVREGNPLTAREINDGEHLDSAMNVPYVALLPEKGSTWITLMIPSNLFLDPKTSNLIRRIKARGQDFAMSNANGHTRLTFRVRETAANIQSRLNFVPWQRHASRFFLWSTVVLTPIALLGKVPPAIVGTWDTFLLAILVIKEFSTGQAKNFMAFHENYVRVLKGFYVQGAFSNGHTSREIIRFYETYYKDFVDILDDDDEVKTLMLVAGTLSKEEVSNLREKKKKVIFEQRLEGVLNQLAGKREEFFKVHEVYLTTLKEANKTQRKLPVKVTRAVLKFYIKNNRNFKMFLTKEEKDETAQLLAASLSESEKRRILSEPKQKEAILKLMYWDLELETAEEIDKVAQKASSEEPPQILTLPSPGTVNHAMSAHKDFNFHRNISRDIYGVAQNILREVFIGGIRKNGIISFDNVRKRMDQMSSLVGNATDEQLREALKVLETHDLFVRISDHEWKLIGKMEQIEHFIESTHVSAVIGVSAAAASQSGGIKSNAMISRVTKIHEAIRNSKFGVEKVSSADFNRLGLGKVNDDVTYNFINDPKAILTQIKMVGRENVIINGPHENVGPQSRLHVLIFERKPYESFAVLFNPPVPVATAVDGGIDLKAIESLQVQNGNGDIKFHLNPAMLIQLQNASGFSPKILSVEPLNDLRGFLGINHVN